MNKTISRFLGIGALILLTGQGCFGGARPADGGLYASIDSGQTWQQRTSIPSVTGQPRSIATVSTRTGAIDPSDNNAIYLGTDTNGLLYTYDQGLAWHQAKDLSAGAVNSIAIDPKDKCTIYATSGATVLKSNDCSRTYKQSFVESRKGITMTALAVDPANPNIVYAGSSDGDLVKSSDFGASWSIAKRFEDKVRQILVYPGDTNQVYVGFENIGIYKTADGGSTWLNITPDRKTFPQANRFRKMVWDQKSGNGIIMANRYGLFRTTNGGDTWDSIDLVTAPGEITLYALAVNPKNSNDIVYSTGTSQSSTLFFSSDGGKTWNTKRAPTRRVVTTILIDPTNPQIRYVAGFDLSTQ